MTEELGYEARKLLEAKQIILKKIADPNIDPIEKMAMQFYFEQLKDQRPVPDKQKFIKYKMGIGGSGDEEMRASYVVRDHQTHAPLTKNGKLIIIPCVFSSFSTYLDIISSGKADSLRYEANEGAHPVNASDKKYIQEDSYASIRDAVRKFAEEENEEESESFDFLKYMLSDEYKDLD